MHRRSQRRLAGLAAALLGLIVLLAALQYRWLGRVSDAERDRIRAALQSHAGAFARDFDRELALAFMLFQMDPLVGSAEEPLAVRLAARYARWKAAAGHPALIRDVYTVLQEDGRVRVQRFDPGSGALAVADLPAGLGELRETLSRVRTASSREGGTLVIRTAFGPLLDDVPALLVPAPLVMPGSIGRDTPPRARPAISYTVLLLDREYITREMLPALTSRHFRATGGALDYEIAVVRAGNDEVVYRSHAGLDPSAGSFDASAELFRLRPQEFEGVAADVRRFIAAMHAPGDRLVPRDGRPFSVVVEATRTGRGLVSEGVAAERAAGRTGWRLLVRHPSGSLEAMVESARRRNLLISTSILGVLGASLVLLVVSTRRSQELARQQMEFVAAVTHELRTPLAVIRSAGDNLADGVVGEADQIRRYGALVRDEGRRLTEMVEGILEFAGIGSGGRTLTFSPVHVRPLVDRIVAASAPLVEAVRQQVEVDIPPDLPPVRGDEPALSRAFGNLVGNAIKYGGEGGRIRISARQDAADVWITVSDQGIGIAPSDQARIFEPFYRAPDVVAARIHGAGLGLSLVQRIVEAHDGIVRLRSGRGEGSDFSVRLPAAGGAARRVERTEAVPPDGRGPARTGARTT